MIGFDSIDGGCSSSDSKRQNTHNCEVVVRINKQNLDISGGVLDGKDDLDVSTGDQIIMFEYVNGGTEAAKQGTRSRLMHSGGTQASLHVPTHAIAVHSPENSADAAGPAHRHAGWRHCEHPVPSSAVQVQQREVEMLQIQAPSIDRVVTTPVAKQTALKIPAA